MASVSHQGFRPARRLSQLRGTDRDRRYRPIRCAGRGVARGRVPRKLAHRRVSLFFSGRCGLHLATHSSYLGPFGSLAPDLRQFGGEPVFLESLDGQLCFERVAGAAAPRSLAKPSAFNSRPTVVSSSEMANRRIQEPHAPGSLRRMASCTTPSTAGVPGRPPAQQPPPVRGGQPDRR